MEQFSGLEQEEKVSKRSLKMGHPVMMELVWYAAHVLDAAPFGPIWRRLDVVNIARLPEEYYPPGLWLVYLGGSQYRVCTTLVCKLYLQTIRRGRDLVPHRFPQMVSQELWRFTEGNLDQFLENP